MSKFSNATNSQRYIFALSITALVILIMQTATSADEYSQLLGYWQCQESGLQSTLEFKSREQLLYNGQITSYQLAPGIIQVQEAEGPTSYFFKLEGNVLVILSPDGSVTQCQKVKKPLQADFPQNTLNSPWPPPYAPPQGRVDENNPGTQALLYKFSGRWDNMTSNTLTNLFLKPDGTYEEAYEAGYSGAFTDQGGYQTGNWGTTGAQQARGRWRIVGGLRQGKLYLVDQNGRERVYTYQVHIQRGEVFWGEYFFNGKLYSVKYIYR